MQRSQVVYSLTANVYRRSLLQMVGAQWIAFHQLAMWAERQIGFSLKDGFGFEHTSHNTKDLAIPNRKVAGAFLWKMACSTIAFRNACQSLNRALEQRRVGVMLHMA